MVMSVASWYLGFEPASGNPATLFFSRIVLATLGPCAFLHSLELSCQCLHTHTHTPSHLSGVLVELRGICGLLWAEWAVEKDALSIHEHGIALQLFRSLKSFLSDVFYISV